jgi:hypothetical protein
VLLFRRRAGIIDFVDGKYAVLRDQEIVVIARAWGSKTPRMPTLALHLKSKTGSQAAPQKIYAVPEPEFRNHIIEIKKP